MNALKDAGLGSNSLRQAFIKGYRAHAYRQPSQEEEHVAAVTMSGRMRSIFHLEESGDADPVEHPAHYELSHPGLECIDLTAGMSFCMGNAVKYVWRYRSKNKPVEDLRKSLWYTHYAENRNEPVALTCRQLGIINALQHQSQTEQYEFQFWNALRFGDYPKMCRAIALMIRLVEGKNIDDINQELES